MEIEDDKITVKVEFGIKEVRATIKFEDEVVAKVWFKQDPDVMQNLRNFVNYATGPQV